MLQLIQRYSFYEIVTFIVLLCIAVKEVLTFIDWMTSKFKKKQDQTITEHDNTQQLADRLNRGEALLNQVIARLDNLEKQVTLLVASDKDDIKSFITKEHYKYTNLGWIDVRVLECCERRFEHYQDEGGNSFVEDLMNDLRALPKAPPPSFDK